ncbi:MAG: hypothetical protein ACLQGV_03560 [Bryobacteraceae bacterium]
MRNNDRDELDDLIDGAVRGYADASPLEGLEERVLYRIHAAPAARRVPWTRRLGVAAPALAALLLAVVVLRSWWKPLPPTVNPVPGHATLNLPVFNSQSPAPRRIHPSRALPKRPSFPSPVPMTDEERALAGWARRAPQEVSQAFADLRKQSEEPVAIQPLAIQALLIEPLPSDGANEGR